LSRYNLADLHTHSFCSDGLRTPTQAAEEAHEAGVQALSLTDHDTVEGVGELLDAGKRLGLDIIAGAEMSAHVKEREVHILAYCLDWQDPGLAQHLDLLRERRHDRGVAIVERLNELGVEISVEEVMVQASGGLVGRPHIAAALVKRGVVVDKEQAFKRYLGDRAPAVVSKPHNAVEDVIALIHSVGGVAVLAHPGNSVSESLVAKLVESGLDGIEVYHPAHMPHHIEHYSGLAEKHGLLQTGGSDSHGEPTGTRIGDYGIGCEAVDALKSRAATYVD
jgi:3',5'-nucleoside bisphosphate phosphatase